MHEKPSWKLINVLNIYPLKFSVRGTSPLKFQGGREIEEKNKEKERKIMKSGKIIQKEVNKWAKTDEFLRG